MAKLTPNYLDQRCKQLAARNKELETLRRQSHDILQVVLNQLPHTPRFDDLAARVQAHLIEIRGSKSAQSVRRQKA